MSFITLNLLLLFSSLKVYAHTHAQTYQVHEISYYVNMCNYDRDGVGQIERETEMEGHNLWMRVLWEGVTWEIFSNEQSQHNL